MIVSRSGANGSAQGVAGDGLDAALPSRHRSPFRADINGLRAIAVVAVILFHFDLVPLPGGFAGVDIFFVISGYLITSILQKDLAAGRLSLLGFYRGRVARIVPALLVLCVVFTVVGYVLIDPLSFRELSAEIVSSLLFYSNIQYLFTSDYFDSVSHDNWLLHTWSLSVEWQFYLLYPVLLSGVWKSRFLRTRLTGIILLATLASLLFAVVVAPLYARYAFYLIPMRAWEFLVGGLIVGAPAPARAGPVAKVACYGGLASIAWAVGTLDSFTAWPSLWTLVPVCGTALVIWSGQADARWADNAVVRPIGLWSYSLYLWHWPVLVTLQYFVPHVSKAQLGLALILAVGCAMLSYRLVEQPGLRLLRAGSGASWKRRAGLAALFLIPLAVALGGVRTDGFERWPGRGQSFARYAEAARDLSYPGECGGTSLRGELRLCQIGPVTSAPPERQILVIGDSFAQQWWASFDRYAQRTPGTGLTFATYGGCTVLPTTGRARPGFRCAAFSDRAFALARSGRFGTVVIASLFIPYFEPSYGPEGPNSDAACFRHGDRCLLVTDKAAFAQATDAAFADFERMVARLRRQGLNVVLILPSPFEHVNYPREMARTAFFGNGTPQRLWIDQTIFEARAAPVRDRLATIARKTGAALADPIPLLCRQGQCSTATAAGVPLYADHLHLRSAFTRESGLAERIMSAVK